MRPRSTSAVNVQPIPARLGSCRPMVLIQPLSALTILAPALCTSIVSGRSQKPSRKPRTAVSAAMRPPLAPPMPSAIAAITSWRGRGSSAPERAPAKSSLFLRGPVFDANPTLARMPVSAAISRVSTCSPRFLQTAATMSKIASGARRDTCREIAGFAVEPVIAAVLWIEPGNLAARDRGRIGIDGGLAVIDHNLPRGAADRIGAGDCYFPLLRLAVHNGQTRCQPGYPGCEDPVAEHGCVHVAMCRSIPKAELRAKAAAPLPLDLAHLCLNFRQSVRSAPRRMGRICENRAFASGFSRKVRLACRLPRQRYPAAAFGLRLGKNCELL